MSAAELAARIMAAAAVRADFERASAAYADDGRPVDWATWAQRLSLALGALVDAGPSSATVAADPRVGAAAGFLARIARADMAGLTVADRTRLRMHLGLVLDAIAGRPR